MLREPNGYWRVRDRSGNIKLIRDLSEKAISQFDEVSVAAYTRSGKNIVRIPLAIWLTDGVGLEKTRNRNKTLSILSQLFDIDDVLVLQSRYGKILESLFIFDDIEICKKLHIEHKFYIKQFRYFAEAIEYLLVKNGIKWFEICGESCWIDLRSLPFSKFSCRGLYRVDVSFYHFARELAESLDCKYIKNILEDKYFRNDTIKALFVLRCINYDIRYVMLFYMFVNSRLNYVRKKWIEKQYCGVMWKCALDCNIDCGIKSPLHIPTTEHSKCYHPVEIKRGIVYRGNISRATLFLFLGCHILRHKKFFLDRIPLHLGIVGYIIQHDEKTRMFIDDFIQKCNDIVFDITQDISLLQIRNLRKVQGTSSILSFSSESAFIRSLRSRSPNYSKRISALKDATPFIESKDKKVCKLNILQFLDFETLIKTFSYGPLKKTGYLERAIVCHTGELSSINIEQIQKIAKFCMNSKDTIYLKINIEKIDKRFSYEFDRDATIFTRQGVRKFFTTIAIQLAILHEITKGNCTIDNDHLQVSEGALDEGCFLANAIIRERDERIRILTKQKRCLEAVKNFIITSKQDFFYHRDLQRRFSSYSPSCLNAVIKRLIGDFLIEEVVPNCPRYRGKVIIYKKQKNK